MFFLLIANSHSRVMQQVFGKHSLMDFLKALNRFIWKWNVHINNICQPKIVWVKRIFIDHICIGIENVYASLNDLNVFIQIDIYIYKWIWFVYIFGFQQSNRCMLWKSRDNNNRAFTDFGWSQYYNCDC